jgi:hypothetical protein
MPTTAQILRDRIQETVKIRPNRIRLERVQLREY